MKLHHAVLISVELWVHRWSLAVETSVIKHFPQTARWNQRNEGHFNQQQKHVRADTYEEGHEIVIFICIPCTFVCSLNIEGSLELSLWSRAEIPLLTA